MRLSPTALPLTALLLLAGSAGSALATGDAEAGKKTFNQCQACHVVVADDGTVLAGKSGRTGPNLYAIIGRPAASVEGFSYGTGIQAAAKAGLVWDEANLATYVQDPTKFLDDFTGDASLKSKMSFKLRKPEDAANVAAFLASLQPAAAN